MLFKETAIMMAKNVSLMFDTDIGVSATGIAEKYNERTPQAYVSIYDKSLNISYNFIYIFKNESTILLLILIRKYKKNNKIYQKKKKSSLKSIKEEYIDLSEIANNVHSYK